MAGRRAECKLPLEAAPENQRVRQAVFDRDLPVAALEDLVRGKVWAWSDAARRPTKRLKDALDLVRLAEVEPDLVMPLLPEELRVQAVQIRNFACSASVDEDSMGEEDEEAV
jgi:hypothetical protein